MGGDAESSLEGKDIDLVERHPYFPAEALVAGSVDEVAEQFRSFEELGYTDTLVRHLSNEQLQVLSSLDRLTAVRAALA